MKDLFSKYFGVPYNGAFSKKASENPTMGLAIALYYRAKGNFGTRKRGCSGRGHNSPVQSRKERFNQ